jgi:hypothetical protein
MREEYDIRGGVRGKYYERSKGGTPQMGRNIDLNEVPDSTLLPDDLYLLEVEDITEETSKAGRFMYRTVYRVQEPATFAGVPLYDYFAIGNEDDPNANEQATWNNSLGARRLRRLAKATMVPLTKDIDELVATIKGQRFSARVGQRVDDGVRDPKYKGNVSNQVVAMYPVGATNDTHVAPPAAASKAATPAPPAAPKAAKAVSASTLSCPFCSETVARSAYNAHVKSNHPDEV